LLLSAMESVDLTQACFPHRMAAQDAHSPTQLEMPQAYHSFSAERTLRRNAALLAMVWKVSSTRI